MSIWHLTFPEKNVWVQVGYDWKKHGGIASKLGNTGFVAMEREQQPSTWGGNILDPSGTEAQGTSMILFFQNHSWRLPHEGKCSKMFWCGSPKLSQLP